ERNRVRSPANSRPPRWTRHLAPPAPVPPTRAGATDRRRPRPISEERPGYWRGAPGPGTTQPPGPAAARHQPIPVPARRRIPETEGLRDDPHLPRRPRHSRDDRAPRDVHGRTPGHRRSPDPGHRNDPPDLHLPRRPPLGPRRRRRTGHAPRDPR